ncbi:hypothetical protein PCE1_001717 [Barthelona sp. PCE]
MDPVEFVDNNEGVNGIPEQNWSVQEPQDDPDQQFSLHLGNTSIMHGCAVVKYVRRKGMMSHSSFCKLMKQHQMHILNVPVRKDVYIMYLGMQQFAIIKHPVNCGFLINQFTYTVSDDGDGGKISEIFDESSYMPTSDYYFTAHHLGPVKTTVYKIIDDEHML